MKILNATYSNNLMPSNTQRAEYRYLSINTQDVFANSSPAFKQNEYSKILKTSKIMKATMGILIAAVSKFFANIFKNKKENLDTIGDDEIRIIGRLKKSSKNSENTGDIDEIGDDEIRIIGNTKRPSEKPKNTEYLDDIDDNEIRVVGSSKRV